MKLHTCKGGLNSTEHYNRTCKANKRNATTKNGFSSPPLISGYKVASLYLIPTINNKGIKQKRIEENKGFAVFHKNAAPNSPKRLPVWLLYPYANRDKIKHNKQANKVLHPCVDMLIKSVLARRALFF